MKDRYKSITVFQYNVEQRLFTYSYYVGEARKATGSPVQQTSIMQASSDDLKKCVAMYAVRAHCP